MKNVILHENHIQLDNFYQFYTYREFSSHNFGHTYYFVFIENIVSVRHF